MAASRAKNQPKCHPIEGAKGSKILDVLATVKSPLTKVARNHRVDRLVLALDDGGSLVCEGSDMTVRLMASEDDGTSGPPPKPKVGQHWLRKGDPGGFSYRVAGVLKKTGRVCLEGPIRNSWLSVKTLHKNYEIYDLPF